MKQFNIPIFRLEFDQNFKNKFKKGCEDILTEGFLTNHTMVKKFEQQLSHCNKSNYCLATSSGTTALETALRALNLKDKEVIVQSNTFIATAVAIKNAGAHLSLVDLEDQYFGMCPKYLESKISNKTGAVIVVHIGGTITPHIQKIIKLCKEYNVPLIEDCAQAFGATLGGVSAGNFGTAGVFSFFTTKNLTTGEGGAVVTNSKEHYSQMKSIRQFGMDLDDPTKHVRDGGNFKLNEFSALMGILELERFDARLKKRFEIAKRYEKNLMGTKFKVLIPPSESVSSHYKTMVITTIPREEIANHLERNKIKLTGGVYYTPLHKQPILIQSFQSEIFPNTDYFSAHHFCPPCYPELTLDEVDFISEKLLELCQ